MEEYVLKGKSRDAFGSRASRRLRAEGELPANLYGHGKPNVSLTVSLKEFSRFFEAGHRAATLEVAGATEHGVVKEVQYGGLGTDLVHVDFVRFDPGEAIEMSVAIDFVGQPKGVTAGGTLDTQLHELQLEGSASQLPEHFKLDISALAIGDSVRLGDIAAPEGCRVLGDPEAVIVSVQAPRDEELPEATGEGGDAAEPEVIKKKSDDEEGAS